MDSRLAKLMEIFAEKIANGDQHSDLYIEEPANNASLKRILINGTNGDWFAVDPDRGRGNPPVMSAILTTDSGHEHNRACDAIIFRIKDEMLRIAYIELKSSPAPSGYSAQFRSTKCFVRYILEIANEFHTIKFNKIEDRYILFHLPGPIGKTPTRPVPKRHSSNPSAPRKEPIKNGGKIHLSMLVD